MKNNMYILNEFVVNKKELLGKGATGQVYTAKNISDHSQVAVKIIDLKTIENQVTEYLLSMEKIAAMAITTNPHVLRGIKIIQNTRFCHIVTELCNGGTLKDAIKHQGALGEERSNRLLKEILKGMCSLIGKGIIHRDLKPANILFHNGQAKIIDFGYCEIKGYPKPNIQYNVGSPSYMAPEAFLENQYSEKSEIWALGVTFYECLNGKTFDDGKNMAEVFREIKKSGLPYKSNVSQQSKKIINWCLQFDPKKRPTAVELYNYLTEEKQERPTSQSVRLGSPQQISSGSNTQVNFRHKMQQKMLEIRQNIDNFWIDGPQKQDIVKPITRTKPGLSTYSQKKKLFEKKLTEKKSLHQAPRFTNGKSTPNDSKPFVTRNKSQLFQAETPQGYMSDRIRSKQNMMGSGLVRPKFPVKKEMSRYRNPINADYYGMSDR